MKNVLVTGGAGFIGSHLCERLIAQNMKVISLDNYSTGSIDNHQSGVEYVEGDTAKINDLIDASVDTVFHLGEYSRVEQSYADISEVWRSNTGGILPVLQFCKNKNAKLIYAGSSTKFTIDVEPKDISPYMLTKRNNTELIDLFAHWFGLKYAITYFYNAYGPREISNGPYATVVSKFIVATREKRALNIVLPGTQTRNFTHVADIISGLVLVAEQGCGDGYGIGSDEEYSINELASLFGGEKKYLPKRTGNRLSSALNTQKTKALGWTPQYDLKAYITNLIDKME